MLSVSFLLTFMQVDGIHSLGGTGAVRIGMDLLRNKMGYETIYVSRPTWGCVFCINSPIIIQTTCRKS